jgi:Zn-dependent peptidase ImmA (M78 family)
VERLALHLGTEVRYEPFEGELSGMLFREKERVVVGVNALHAKTRQRFTVAHELGHFLLHRGDLFVDKNYRVLHRDARSSEAIDQQEIQANRFAAELLMPARFLAADIKSGKVVLDIEDDDEIEKLAARYKVSTQAMTFRLAHLGYIHLPE